MEYTVEEFISMVERRDAHEPQFIQAVQEVAEVIIPYIKEHKQYQNKYLLERMVEAERMIMFRVSWVNDKGEVQVNRGYRVQMNSAIGPYKGGTRFHPTVNLDTMKFLAFEQTLKNALTTLPMGGGKGGSDFDPVGKTDGEVMRFCQSYMTELCRHIGPDLDVPAGDLGVGAREIGYLFGQYKRIRNEFTGVLTGKGTSYGGSLIRPESTGYGLMYFCEHMLATKGESIKGKTLGLSGFGNAAWGVANKAVEMGAKIITISGPDGYVYDEEGLDREKIAWMQEIRASGRDKVEDYLQKYPKAKFVARKKPWEQKMDIAVPASIQNELTEVEAKQLVDNGLTCLLEAANMPCTPGAIKVFQEAKVLYSPGKASNAGGVATSGLEMTQNSLRLSWTAEKVDTELRNIMKAIHDSCVEHGLEKDGYINYVKGANIAGFVKIADAVIAEGVI